MAPQKGTKRKAKPAEEQPEPSSSAQDLPVRAKSDSPEVSRAPKPSVKGTLKVFDDDDEDDDAVISTKLSAVEKPTVTAESDEDSESDDDDAPEAAATTHVVSKAEKSAQSARQAAQEQAAEQKRKRQQQDALFKKQASQRKAAKPVHNDDSTEEAAESSLSKNIKGPALNLLPDELLESSSEEESDAEDMDSLVDTRPKRRKISVVEQKLARGSRGPKDERVGSTVYRVEKKSDQRLAPKAKKYTQNRKADLLHRGRAAVQSRGGFFKK